MDRFASSGFGSLRSVRQTNLPCACPNLVPFGPLGGGQWTGHPIGLLIVFGFVLIALIGVPESRLFFALSLALSVIFGCALYFWHRSKSFF
jgi:hypothetical protein